MKKLLLGIGLLLILLLIVIILLPVLIDLNKYQDRYRPLIEEALNRKIALADVQLTLIPRLGARVAGFTVMDDPAFSSGPFASLASLNIGIKVLPLLGGRVEVEEITLKEPVITIVRNQQGVMNVSTLGTQGLPKKAPEQPQPPAEGPLRALAMLTVDEVSLTGGRLIFDDHSAKKPTGYRISDLAVHLQAVRLGETPHLKLSAMVEPHNLPISVNGHFGPLIETLDFKIIDLTIDLGKTALALKGSAVGGRFDLALSSPVVQSVDLPVTLPLTKPVQVRDLRVTTEGRYPIKEGVPIQDAVDVKSLEGDVVSGNSIISLKGSAIGGKVQVTATSSGVNSADVPIALPLTKPVLVKNLHLEAQMNSPLKKGVPPLELVDVPTLNFAIVSGNSVVTVKGMGTGGQAMLTATAPVLHTVDLPVALPLRKSIEAKDIRLVAAIKGQDIKIQNLSLNLLGGQLSSEGRLTIGSKVPPFGGKVMMQRVQLGPVADALADKISVSGNAGAQLALQGRGFSMPELIKSLTGNGHFTVKDGKLEGINLLQEAVALLKATGVKIDHAKGTVFSTIEGDVGIRDGLITVERARIESHDYQATARGTVGFDQALNLKTNLALSEALSKQITGTSPIAKLALSKGRLTVHMIITGTAQAPVYALDGKAIGGTVTEQVNKRAKEVIGDILKGKDRKGLDLEKGAEALKKLFGR